MAVKKFISLLSDELTDREVAKWIKSWTAPGPGASSKAAGASHCPGAAAAAATGWTAPQGGAGAEGP